MSEGKKDEVFWVFFASVTSGKKALVSNHPTILREFLLRGIAVKKTEVNTFLLYLAKHSIHWQGIKPRLQDSPK